MKIAQVPAETKNLNCVVVGDGGVGKTCLLSAFAFRLIPVKYVPTIFDYITVKVGVNRTPYKLCLTDTSGLEDYDRLRPLCYTNPRTDVFLICFSTVSPGSFNNVGLKWVTEITEHSPQTPFIIVGTQIDLRHDAGVVANLATRNLKPITTTQGRRLAKELKAECYVECSALTFKGITGVFHEGIRVAVTPPENQECVIS